MIRIIKIIIAVLVLATLTGVNIIQSPIMGVHIEGGNLTAYPWLVEPSWVRMWVRWTEIESEPGVYAWNSIHDEGIFGLGRSSNKIALTIITTPEWARRYPEVRCSPPAPEYMVNYVAFIIAVIERYSPDAIELGNEPEVPHYLIGDRLDHWIGCWGPDGFEYAEMLKLVYPVVKTIYPDVTIVAGSLMLDDTQQNFWPQALEAGASGFYDVLSYHAYTDYPINDFEIISRKAEFLRSIGETAPLWLTETSLLCRDEYVACENESKTQQADFIRYIMDRREKSDFDLAFWFTLANNHWNNSDLVHRREPKPVWFEYRDIVQGR